MKIDTPEAFRIRKLVERGFTAEDLLRACPGYHWEALKKYLIQCDISVPADPVEQVKPKEEETPLDISNSFLVLLDQIEKQAAAVTDTVQAVEGIVSRAPTEAEMVACMSNYYALWYQLEEPRMLFHRFAAFLLHRNFIIIPRPILKPISDADHLKAPGLIAASPVQAGCISDKPAS
jgi:hypothetical protein